MLIRNIPPVVFVFVFVFFIASQIMPALAIGDRVRAASATAQWWISSCSARPKLIDNFFLGPHLPFGVLGRLRHRDRARGHRSVPRAQIEAGDSLGMSRLDVLRFVVLPQALRNVLPPLAGQFIQLIKDTSLVSLVSMQEADAHGPGHPGRDTTGSNTMS